MSALATPIADNVAVTATSQAVTLSRASQFVVFTNLDDADTVTINVNGATAVSTEGIVLAAGAQITLDLSGIGSTIKKFACVCPATKTATLAYMAL